ncbi:hypothetical protein KSP39_PZI013348 [Platanthera zijinensis]|uniref:Retrotransposon gag domain-containing protein n=1 Tax=Platanthera zijinensis TaxID=2320716 RepID=A0AAP0BDA1_9ASPA
MVEKFLMKYFPPAKTAKLRNDISTYVQLEAESLYDTWERFKELLRRCPHHALPSWLQIQTFYNGLNPATRQMIDAASGGTLNNKTPEAAQQLIEEMAMNSYQWTTVRPKPTKPAGMYEVDAVTALAIQVEKLHQKMDNLSLATPPMVPQQWDPSLVGIPSGEPQVQEHVDYMGNNPRPPFNPANNPYSFTCNQGWRNHPNFSWGGQGNQGKQPVFGQQQQQLEPRKPTLEDVLAKFMQTTDVAFRNQEGSIRNLENQIGQLARMVSERQQGTLPGNTETNPKEHARAIQLRSGKELQDPRLAQDAPQEESSGEAPNVTPMEYQPAIPYPAKINKERMDAQYGKFLSMIKQLHVNLPFSDIIQMPKYAKFLKDLISNKRKIEELSLVTLSEECSAILQNKLPQKLKDPGSFSIPCLIGDLQVNKALADLGASINLMPYKLYLKLGLGELSPTRMSIQLADRSVKYPRGIVEDVLVKVDKFIFPADFVILDMDENIEVPLILGRPFLATSRALIDVFDGKLVLRVGEDEVTFQIGNTMKQSLDSDDCCYFSHGVDDLMTSIDSNFYYKGPLEICITNCFLEDETSEDIVDHLFFLDSSISMNGNTEYNLLTEGKHEFLKNNTKNPPVVELKNLPDHLSMHS